MRKLETRIEKLETKMCVGDKEEMVIFRVIVDMKGNERTPSAHVNGETLYCAEGETDDHFLERVDQYRVKPSDVPN